MISIEMLREFLQYEPNTGILIWRKRSRKHFSTDWSWRRWNKMYADKQAFLSSKNGYASAVILGQDLLAHIVCWAIYYGKFPSDDLDHIDGNRKFNAIHNLREANKLINAQNQKIPKSNSSGVMGVSWNKRNQMWKAYYHKNSKQILVGYFHDIEEAEDARQKAVMAAGFHPNHGRSS